MDATYCLKMLNAENLQKVLGYEFKGEFTIEGLMDISILEELGFEYAIVYNYDSVISDRISEVVIDIDNIMEARFFNNSSEIRIFSDEGQLSGTIFNEKDTDSFISKDLILYPRYGEKSHYAKKLQIKKYIDYDEDNQAYISYLKPSKLIF